MAFKFLKKPSARTKNCGGIYNGNATDKRKLHSLATPKSNDALCEKSRFAFDGPPQTYFLPTDGGKLLLIIFVFRKA